MMQGECIGYLIGGAGGLGATLLALRQPRLKRRTFDEVAPFLYDPNQDMLSYSFDEKEDMVWRRQGDRRLQWVRMEIFRKCLSVKVDNVRIIYEWALTERFDNQQDDHDSDDRKSVELISKIDRVINSAKEYLSLAWSVRWRLYVAARSRFRLIPLMPVPQLAGFATVRSVNLVEAYRAVGEAGEELALVHGGAALAKPVTDKIRLCFWMTY